MERRSEGKNKRGSDVKKTRSELQRFKFRHCVLSIYCFSLIFAMYSFGLSISVYVSVVRPC